MADAPSTAIRKVLKALAALPNATCGANIFIDRSDDEPLDASERPGMVLRVPHIAFSLREGMTLNTATVQADFQSGNTAGETIDAVNQQAIADFIAAIGADRTLGGMLQTIEEADASGSEQSGADVGCAILTLEALFFTPRGDLRTIVGQSGQHF